MHICVRSIFGNWGKQQNPTSHILAPVEAPSIHKTDATYKQYARVPQKTELLLHFLIRLVHDAYKENYQLSNAEIDVMSESKQSAQALKKNALWA